MAIDEIPGVDGPSVDDAMGGAPPPARGWRRVLEVAVALSPLVIMVDVILLPYVHGWFECAGMVACWVLGPFYFAWAWRSLQQRAGDDANVAGRLAWAKRSWGVRIGVVALVATWIAFAFWAVALIQSNFAMNGAVAFWELVTTGSLGVSLLVGGFITMIEWLITGV